MIYVSLSKGWNNPYLLIDNDDNEDIFSIKYIFMFFN